VRALVQGYDVTVTNQAASAADLESRVAGLDPQLVKAELAAITPAFRAPDGRVGELDLGPLRAWAAWEARFGIVRRPPDVETMFDPSFVNGAR